MLLAASLVTLTLVGIPNCTDPNATWASASIVLDSGDGKVHSTVPFGPQWIHQAPPQAGQLHCFETQSVQGYDAVGTFTEVSHWWRNKPSASEPHRAFVTRVRIYGDNRTLQFQQSFLDPPLTNLSTGNADGVITGFPSLRVQTKGTPLGYAHFAGHMAGNTPQYGKWAPGAASQSLVGGMRNSGVIVLFDEAATASVVVSPSSAFMAASLAVRKDLTTGDTICDFGVMGDVDTMPSEDFHPSWIMVASPQGPADAVRTWGTVMRTLYSRQSEEESHAKDITTRVLGYGTDNGAYYYYYTGANASKTYDDVLREVKAYSVAEQIPYGYIELDSWWYYRQDGADKFGVPVSGVTNWTAMPSVLPDGGLPGAYAITGWPVMAHNRYFATNNVYAANPLDPIGPTLYDGPKFNFTWGIGAGLPTTVDFWDNLFAMNSNWGLAVYLQDWLSMATSVMPQLLQDATFGRTWLRNMGAGAAKHNLTVQYCMSFPRHVLQALEIPAVTQARASDDYQPQTNIFCYDQWAIAESSLWTSAIGVVPSKDNFWTMTTPQYTPHYDPFFMTRETRCRLESVSASMSNGPVLIGDRVGYSNRTLIMKACDASGRLLRPSTAAAPLDMYFVAKAFDGPRGRLHATWSFPGIATSAHAYILSVNLDRPRNVTAFDLPEAVKTGLTHGDVAGWLAYEANTTDVVRVVTATQPLTLKPSDEWSFEYFTLAPIAATVASKGKGWVFLGEQSKHIAASQQRFPAKTDDPVTGDIVTVVDGAVGEEVTVAFADFETLRVASTTCTLASQQMKLTWLANGTAVCVPHL